MKEKEEKISPFFLEPLMMPKQHLDRLFKDLFLLSKTLQLNLNIIDKKHKNINNHEIEIMNRHLYEVIFSGIKDILKSEYLLLVVDSLFQQNDYQNVFIKQIRIEKFNVIIEIEIYGLYQGGLNV